MSALAQNITNQASSESVTAISATARVDYILRFSKQAILVVDNDIAVSSSVGSQYLANLSNEQNAAYITMSAKLNDLQVRCRIIEQLFGNILFDPEQSVAVSIINLVKADKQAVTIVVDNAHYLSLQLCHELTQLAEIAKKSDYQINVLMLANSQVGQVLSQNYGLFQKKLSILSAQTGQLVSISDQMFKGQSDFFTFTPFKKWLVFFLLLSSMSAAVVYSLYQRDSLGFSKVATDNSSVLVKAETKVVKEQGTQFVTDVAMDNNLLANNNDIYKALQQTETDLLVPAIAPSKAMPLDILGALQPHQKIMLDSDSDKQAVEKQTEQKTAQSQHEPVLANVEAITKQPDTSITEQVVSDNAQPNVNSEPESEPGYQDQQQGFAIQIGAFSQEQVLAEFISQFSNVTFYQYQRLLADAEVTIVTSEYYPTREQAERALNSLPLGIQQRSPWIKTISAINSEISEFQLSQSEKNQVTIPNS
ncbi:hypothetical protein tinsulaeT_21720 [Thalassotalea insulae]|uniref:SPOR domain-containing protein n=1 Tax=Thalassotalea insulae TaxID=2056778 RepID=A0ABQ6GU04_9GAMM|nr:SPOR domain-containing protein [Thalassotalea insulae]GLX78832.1 hypothetical protein tinsulaeT_21720 [Thalassotalea insulae]